MVPYQWFLLRRKQQTAQRQHLRIHWIDPSLIEFHRMSYPPTMKQTIAIVALSIFLVPLMHAQDKKSSITALSEPALGERGTSRILYWNEEKNMAVAAVAVDFGRPVWKKEYENPAGFDRM